MYSWGSALFKLWILNESMYDLCITTCSIPESSSLSKSLQWLQEPYPYSFITALVNFKKSQLSDCRAQKAQYNQRRSFSLIRRASLVLSSFNVIVSMHLCGNFTTKTAENEQVWVREITQAILNHCFSGSCRRCEEILTFVRTEVRIHLIRTERSWKMFLAGLSLGERVQIRKKSGQISSPQICSDWF